MAPRRSGRLTSKLSTINGTASPIAASAHIASKARPNGVAKPKSQSTTAPKTAPNAKTANTSSSDPIVLFVDESLFATYIATNDSPIWLQLAKKSAPIPTITYAEALEVALCHGWIDGQRRSHSDTHFIQRFTPRRKSSLWSQRNVEIVERLMAEGKMMDAGMKEVDAAKADGRWDRAYARARDMTLPKEMEELLQHDEAATKTYEGLSKNDKFAVCWRVATLKTEAGRLKKAKGFVEALKAGKSPV